MTSANRPATLRLLWARNHETWFGLVYWGLTPQQRPGSYQGGEMMMIKSVFWWRKPEYPEETTETLRRGHPALYTKCGTLTVDTQHSTQNVEHWDMDTQHSTQYVEHSQWTPTTLHKMWNTHSGHPALYTQCGTLTVDTQHSTQNVEPWDMDTQHSTNMWNTQWTPSTLHKMWNTHSGHPTLYTKCGTLRRGHPTLYTKCPTVSTILFHVKGTPSIPETYLSSSVAWGLNLRVGWWRQILKKCKFSNRSSGPTAIVFPSNCFLVSRDNSIMRAHSTFDFCYKQHATTMALQTREQVDLKLEFHRGNRTHRAASGRNPWC